MTPIATTADLVAFCRRLEGAPFVAVDTEFMRETTYWPRLCLIQAATPTQHAVIDPLAEGLDLAPFLAVLRDPDILKVFHAARQDIEIFSYLQAIPTPLFDTQVAAMAAGFAEQVGYDSLVRQMLGIELDKSHRFTDWARRPLTEAQLSYAIGDVTHLAELYPQLRARLEKGGRLEWVMEEMAALGDPDLYDVTPANAWRRLRPRRHGARYLAIFRAVAAWRETMAQERDQPRGRIVKDDAIDEIASQAPLDAHALGSLRALPKGFAGSRFAPSLLETVHAAVDAAASAAPEPKRPPAPRPPPGSAAAVELLKVLLKSRAEDAKVASRLIATVADLEKIAADDNADTPALTGWRRETFGEDALKLKRGEIALVLDGDRVRAVQVRRRPRQD